MSTYWKLQNYADPQQLLGQYTDGSGDGFEFDI